MNRLRIIYRELCLYILSLRTGKKINDIDFTQIAKEQIRNEIKNLVKSISNAETESNQKHFFYCFLILIRALKRISEDKSNFLFRRTSLLECLDAKILPIVRDKNKDSNWYYFFETYEYRFVLLLNFSKKTGCVLHMATASDHGDDIRKALKDASLRAKSFLDI